MRCSNNTTVYEAIVAGLELALQILVTSLTIYDDSELIIKQLYGEHNMNEMDSIAYHKKAK